MQVLSCIEILSPSCLHLLGNLQRQLCTGLGLQQLIHCHNHKAATAAGAAERELLVCSDSAGNNEQSVVLSKTIFCQEFLNDFDTSKGGDRKILRAIGRTATVNAVVAASTMTGGVAGMFAAKVAGFATGGAITATRFGEGIEKNDNKEVAKSLAVYGSATTALSRHLANDRYSRSKSSSR